MDDISDNNPLYTFEEIFLAKSLTLDCIIDTNLKFTQVTNYAAKALGFSNFEQMVGKSDYDAKCPAVEHAPVFQAQDMQVINLKTPLTLFEVIAYTNDETKMILTKKVPIISNNNVIGVIAKAKEFSRHQIANLRIFHLLEMRSNVKQVLNRSYALQKTIANLSVRESQVLFYLLRGKSAREIGLFLNISARTVESYIETIKDKFTCNSKSQLIEYSILYNLIDIVPLSLINNPSIKAGQ